MKNTVRLALALLVCVILCVCITPAACADEAKGLATGDAGTNSASSGGFVIPKSVTVIGADAFSGCTWMESVTIPAGVTRIGKGAFSDCTGLKDVIFEGTQEQWSKVRVAAGNDVLSSAPARCADSAAIVASGSKGNLSWTLDKNGLLVISGSGPITDAWQARNTSIQSVIIRSGVTSIGWAAFSGCTGLTSVTIPDSVTSISYQAFQNCSGLMSVTIGDGVTSIGEAAFRGCSGLTSVTIPNSVTSIGSYAFDGCSGLKSVTIPNSVTSIGDMAFYGCTGLTSVEISSLEAWCKISFGTPFSGFSNPLSSAHTLYLNGTKQIDLVIPEGVTSISYKAFQGCTGLTSVTIPNSVTSISYEAFQGCSGLTSVTIPDSVTSIGGDAFSGCTGLTSVTIPDSVTSIDYYAFYGCSRLTIYCYRDSEAYRYAVSKNIDYELIDAYSDHVVFDAGIYKEANTLTNVSFDWSFDLFENASTVPSKELAIASLILSADAYEWDLLSSAFEALEFSNPEPYRYDGYDGDINRVAYGIASKKLDINGRDTNIIVIACRGTKTEDDKQSNITQMALGFRFAAEDVKTNLDQYILDKRIDTGLPTKLLITGHSRGAAVANILGTIVSDITSNNNVYVYTFATPNTTTESNRRTYDNIFNILVEGDPVPGNPGMIGGDNVFGKIVRLTASVDDEGYNNVFKSITGGVSTAAIDFNEDCITGYQYIFLEIGNLRRHTPAVYLSCILEPCGTATGYSSLVNELNRAATCRISTSSR